MLRADEVILTTMVHSHTDRVRCYELLAAEFGLVFPAGMQA